MKGLAIHNFKNGQVWRHAYLGTHYKLSVGTDDLWILTARDYDIRPWLPFRATTAKAAFGGAHDEFALVERSPIDREATTKPPMTISSRLDRAKDTREMAAEIKQRLESALDDLDWLSKLLDSEYSEMGKS
jgi:hypothetical protein